MIKCYFPVLLSTNTKQNFTFSLKNIQESLFLDIYQSKIVVFGQIICLQQSLSMQNQFISAPLLVSKSLPDNRDQIIQNLQAKNQKLKQELYKIQKALQTHLDEQQQPKKRESLFQGGQNLQALHNELTLIYKKITMYDYEVKKLQEGKGGNLTGKIKQLELMLIQKKQMTDKLKGEFLKQQKVAQQNSKKLQKTNLKEELDLQIKKLSDQSKFYKQKLRFLQERQSIRASNMKRQLQAVKKIEKQLLQQGFAAGQLEQIRNFALKGREAIVKQSEQIEQIQDRTKQNYLSLIGEIALLQKMANEFPNKYANAEKDQNVAIQKNMASRNKLLQCEHQMETLEKQLLYLKSHIIPLNLKPLRPLRSFSTQHAPPPNKVQVKNIGKSKGLSHLLKYDQVGMSSSKGQRFTDRTVLGKNNLNAKIIGVKVYLDRMNSLIAGINVTYSGNKKGGDHVKKDRESRQPQYTQQQFHCRGSSFVKSISGTLNNEDRVQSLFFTSSDGSSHRFGKNVTTTKSFYLQISSSQFPTCVFGSLIVLKDGPREKSYIQHLGFQLQNQSGGQGPLINEFDD